jgi:membrane fusion protein, multidrug efflux system
MGAIIRAGSKSEKELSNLTRFPLPTAGLALLPIAAAAFLASACSGSQGDPAAKPARPRLMVRVAPVLVQEVIYQIKALGSLEAEEMVQVTAEVEGAISDVRFHEGDRVNPQTPLAQIDPERYRVELDRAKAALDQSKAELGRAQADLKRREELSVAQLIAPEEMTRSQGENARLGAAVEVTRAALGIAQQNFRKSEVRAPRGGVINTRTVETGQYVKLGGVLATLVDTSRLRLRFKVSDGESLRARQNGDVQFRVSALGPQDFPAKIYHVGEVADPSTRQVEVLAWVKNPGPLKPGFFAEVTLAGEARKNALVVPEGAVQASEQGFVTYVVDQGKAHLRPIEIGLRSGNGSVEILSGVKPKETVVIEGSDRLADGIEVQPVTAAAASLASSPSPEPAR